jgi:hypothetical protein
MTRILASITYIHRLLKVREMLYLNLNISIDKPHSTTGDPASNQPYPSGSAEEEDPVLQAAIAQSRHYSRDQYRGGESSSAAYAPYGT